MPTKKDGKPLPETEAMKIWREEFKQLTLEDHNHKLRQLGLDDEDIEEFDEDFKGAGHASVSIVPGEWGVEEEMGMKRPKKKT